MLTLAVMALMLADDPKPVAPKAADGDAKLAEGFPDATKPGAIEVKTYPAYRGAVATGEGMTGGSGDALFFPLFLHIQKNKVEMTAPVISQFADPRMVEDPKARGEMSMEFVYPTPRDGKPGPDGKVVKVVDHPAKTFVCLGVQGRMGEGPMRDGMATLKGWLDAHKAEYAEDGPPRRVGYHGPMTPEAQRLWEVQLPVKKVGAATKP